MNKKVAIEKWPKEVHIYVHGDEESNFDKGQQLGLSERDNQEKFMGCTYELDLKYSVNKDGTNRLISVDNIKLDYEQA